MSKQLLQEVCQQIEINRKGTEERDRVKRLLQDIKCGPVSFALPPSFVCRNVLQRNFFCLMCHVLCVWDALVVLFWLPSLPHFWQKVITCEVEHFVSLIAFGRSSNLENASGSLCIMITKKKMYQLDKLKYQPLFCNVVISERKFPSSSLQWGSHRNY